MELLQINNLSNKFFIPPTLSSILPATKYIREEFCAVEDDRAYPLGPLKLYQEHMAKLRTAKFSMEGKETTELSETPSVLTLSQATYISASGIQSLNKFSPVWETL